MYGLLSAHCCVLSIHYVWSIMARLTRSQWIEEGLLALQEDGPPALAADRMSKRLGVTRGSFYWHFANALDFAAAVLGAWEDRWTHRIIVAVEKTPGLPRERLLALIEKTGGQDASLYASAKRMAREHSEFEESMHRIDQHRVGFVAGLLVEGGVSTEMAARRAKIIYAGDGANAGLRRQAGSGGRCRPARFLRLCGRPGGRLSAPQIAHSTALTFGSPS
jgi:AcrR family transcriptional regulator